MVIFEAPISSLCCIQLLVTKQYHVDVINPIVTTMLW